jgi:MFS family permease
MTTEENALPPAEGALPGRIGWLNRNVVGAGLTSFLADAGYETATTILPAFLAVLGAPDAGPAGVAFGVAALWLGLMEGVADAVSSSVKLAVGWWSDKLGHRKALVTIGYALTGLSTALFAVAVVPVMVLVSRTVAWVGRGLRGPLRDAILADSVEPADRGKVFGFHRAGDTVGAIVGPLLGVWLLAALYPHAGDDHARAYRVVFLLTLIPAAGSAAAFALLVRERRHTPNPHPSMRAALRALPARFRSLLVAIGVFGAGDFAHTLLILAAVQLLTPEHGRAHAAVLAGLLYTLRNVVYAAASFPLGALSDRFGRLGLLVAGYVLAAGVMAGFAAALAAGVTSLGVLGGLFALAGVYIAVEDGLERALTADLVPDRALRGTAYGIVGTVNGVGDFVSSAAVGVLWYFYGPVPGFAAAAVLMLVGAVFMYRVPAGRVEA